jgi:hypothetical protein
MAPAPACAAPRSLGSKDRVEGGGELRVPVAEQKLEAAEPVPKLHDQVAGLLYNPRSGWMLCDTEHVDPAGRYLDREQHMQPLQEDGVHGEEVDGQHALGLGVEELPPGDR